MEENDREFLIGVIEKLDIFIVESSDEFETNTGENLRQEVEKLKRILEKMDYLEVENEELKIKQYWREPYDYSERARLNFFIYFHIPINKKKIK